MIYLSRSGAAEQLTRHDPTVQNAEGPVWWILPGAVVYPEELGVGTDILEVVFGCDDVRSSRWLVRQIHGFLEGGLMGLNSMQARDAADRGIPVEGGAVPVGGEVGGPILPVSLAPGFVPVGPPNAVDAMAEVRILAVHWQNGDRYLPFKEIVPQLRCFRSAGVGLGGDFSVLEYLRELACTGAAPTVRSRGFASDNLPSAWSVFAVLELPAVLETALEGDQLKVGCTVAAEICTLRLQLIENAHSANPENPDYTLSDFYIGFASKHENVIVSNTLAKHVAAKAAERSSILKERRKFADERRLRNKGKGEGKGK